MQACVKESDLLYFLFMACHEVLKVLILARNVTHTALAVAYLGGGPGSTVLGPSSLSILYFSQKRINVAK